MKMARERFKLVVLTILWSASMSEVTPDFSSTLRLLEELAEKAKVCSMPHAEKGDCRATKIKYTFHEEQDR